MTYFVFWLPLAAVGFPPWMILLEQSISLTFQLFIHTERVKRLPAPIEWSSTPRPTTAATTAATTSTWTRTTAGS